MELSQLLSGIGQVSGAINSFNPSASSAGTSAPASSSGSGGFAGLGSTIGSFLPGGSLVGGVLGGLVDAIGNAFSPGGVPDHERPDLIKISQDNDITQDQASQVCAFEESKQPRMNYDTICARAARDRGYFQQLLAQWNAANPGQQIQTKAVRASNAYGQLQAQAAQMFSGAQMPNPLANLSLAGAQSAAQQQSMTLEDYLKALLNGALGGLASGTAEAAADTPAGQQLKWDTIKSYAKEYQLPLAGLGALFVWMGFQTWENLSDH